jgi:hypothetical protein
MKCVIALAAVIIMLGTELPSVAQARPGGQTGTKTSTGKAQPQPVTPKAKPKSKEKPKEKPKAKAKATPKATAKATPKATAKPTAKATPKATAKATPKSLKKTTTKAPPTTAGTTAVASTMTGPGSVTAATPTIPPVRNQSLEARLQPLLPSGMSASDASKGFRNWGRFVAAVHASRNLNIPFQSLKLKMTGDMPLSLGQAIQAIRSGSITPTAIVTHNSTAPTASAVTQAEQQAAEDFRHVRDDGR